MQIITDLVLDVTRRMPVRQYLVIPRGDNGTRILRVWLTNMGEPVEVSEDVTAWLCVRKPDVTETVTEGYMEKGAFLFELKAQTLSCIGDAICDVQLISGLDVLTSVPFELRVVPSVIGNEEIASSSEYNVLATALLETQEALSTAQAILERISAGGIVYGPGAFSGGNGSVAGMRGYYWCRIENFDSNPMITLTKEQGAEPEEAFEIAYEVGDVVSIVNDSKYPNCATITAIDKNVITVDSLPFTEIKEADNVAMDDCSIFVEAKPEKGVVPLGHYAFVWAEDSIALERSAFVAGGKGNQSLGQYSHTENRGNKARYCCHAEGRDTYAEADCTHTEGRGTRAKSPYQHIQGKYNIIDEKKEFAHILGNGSSDTKRSNAHTIDWKGNGWFAGDVTVGKDKKKLITKDEVLPVMQNVVGTWVCKEYVAGVSVGFSLKLNYMLPVDGYAVFIKGENVSGLLTLEDGFTTAPAVFDTDMVDVVLYQGEDVFAALSAQKTIKINTAVCGILITEVDGDE